MVVKESGKMPSITDWLMVIITGVYVIATILICMANIKSAKATREQVVESKRQFDEENRAFVTVNFEVIRNGLAVLHIKNNGKRVANKVQIRIAQSFLDNVHEEAFRKDLDKLCAATFTLGVAQSWYICIGTILQLKELSQEIIAVDITYNDNLSEYDETITIDLKQYHWALMYNSSMDDIYQEIRKATKSIQSIDRSCREIKEELKAFRPIDL